MTESFVTGLGFSKVMFRQNTGVLDRAIRLVIGIALLVISLVGLEVMDGNIWGIITAVVGLLFLTTVASGLCPIYRLFGISSKKCQKG